MRMESSPSPGTKGQKKASLGKRSRAQHKIRGESSTKEKMLGNDVSVNDDSGTCNTVTA